MLVGMNSDSKIAMSHTTDNKHVIGFKGIQLTYKVKKTQQQSNLMKMHYNENHLIYQYLVHLPGISNQPITIKVNSPKLN